jgi:hypothetical protein
MIQQVNNVLKQLGTNGLEVYDIPHVSIGWMLPKEHNGGQACAISLTQELVDKMKTLRVCCKVVRLRIGQKVYNIDLRS